MDRYHGLAATPGQHEPLSKGAYTLWLTGLQRGTGLIADEMPALHVVFRTLCFEAHARLAFMDAGRTNY